MVIVFTWWGAYYSHISGLLEFSFMFHLIPYGIGFTGGTSILSFIYYIILWLLLSLIFRPVVVGYNSSEKKRLFLTIPITSIILLLIILVFADNRKNRKREKMISENLKQAKIDFKHFRTGDIIFQTITEEHNLALPNDTNLIYNHLGIVHVTASGYTVLAAEDRVKYTSLRHWINKGVDSNYIVKRLINADSLFTSERINTFHKEGQKNIVKDYDKKNEWSDDKIYCSELVWKVYKRAFNIEIGKLEYRKNIYANSTEDNKDLEEINQEKFITPTSILNSDKLITITEK
jgi:uncharacterized protein YycO